MHIQAGFYFLASIYEGLNRKGSDKVLHETNSGLFFFFSEACMNMAASAPSWLAQRHLEEWQHHPSQPLTPHRFRNRVRMEEKGTTWWHCRARAEVSDFQHSSSFPPDFTRTVPVLQCQCSQCFTVLLVWLWSTWNNSYTKTLIPPVVIWVLPSAYHLYSCTLGVLTPISKLPFCGQTPISLTYLLTQIFISTSES